MEASSAAKKILRSFPREVQEYFEKLDKRCQKHGIILKLSSGLSLNFGNGRASGLMDAFNKKLSVALGKGWEHAFRVALHESSHLDQALDSRSVWHNPTIDENYNKFFQWLSGANHKNPEKLVSAVIAIERDCERRTLLKIRKKYSHLIDPEQYARLANAYLASHRWILKNRRWLRDTPYNRKITAHCASKLWRSFDNLPEALEMAMDRYL